MRGGGSGLRPKLVLCVSVCVHVCMVATRTGVVLDGGDGEERANVDDITEDAVIFCLKEYVHVDECLNKIIVAAEHGAHTVVSGRG